MHIDAVALIEPQFHVNVGHVARLMKNFGLRRLYFIGPHFDRYEAVRYAMHGKDVLAAARTVTLQQLRKRFDVLIGTTAISATSRLNVLRESVSAEQLARIIREGTPRRFCIVLGREPSGMNNNELAMCDLVCTVDTRTKYRTMNVAHALAILLYELSRQQQPPPAKATKKMVRSAAREDIDLLLRYVGEMAAAANYDSHKRPLLDSAIKKLIAKSAPTAKDVMLLVSLCRKTMLAIGRRKKSAGKATEKRKA